MSPDGQTTTLNVVNGQLDGVTYPDGSGYGFTYRPDGLLTGRDILMLESGIILFHQYL